jgi:very-short-patch-repair endonuclease
MKELSQARFVSACESPIEVILAEAICATITERDRAEEWTPRLYAAFDAKKRSEFVLSGVTFIAPQVRIETPDARYRVDFFVFCAWGKHFQRFAVECDGLEWHAKSPQQVIRDKKRDRDLLEAGVTTIRFSGAEIASDPAACAGFIMSLIERTVGDLGWIASQINGGQS